MSKSRKIKHTETILVLFVRFFFLYTQYKGTLYWNQALSTIQYSIERMYRKDSQLPRARIPVCKPIVKSDRMMRVNFLKTFDS